jgi:eukaryotic-like serine/threonine-protein kinase
VELVYWKDIKESTDPADLESFLEKFPAGIYADLARRRLRKLTDGANTSPDQTVLTGTDAAGGVADDDGRQDLDATRLRTDTASSAEAIRETEPSDVNPAAESATRTEADDDKRLAVEPPSPDMPEPVAQLKEPEAAVVTADATEPAHSQRRRPIATLVGAGALLLAGLVAFMWANKSPEPSQAPLVEASAPAPAPALTASAPASVASVASVGNAPETASVPDADVKPADVKLAAIAKPAARVKPAAEKKPAADMKPAADVKPVAGPAAAGPVQSKTTVPAKTATADKTKPASSLGENPRPVPTVTATAAREESPAEVCKDRMFLMRELCLAEACEKPGSRKHPLCVTWREEKRLREESKTRQSPP